MRSHHYIHPEFGFLVPTVRLRRELRIGLLSTLFGIGVGVVALTTLGLGDYNNDGASRVGIGNAIGTSSSALRERVEENSIHAGTTEKAVEITDGRNPKPPATPPSSTDRGAKTCRGDDLSCSNAADVATRRTSPRRDSPAIARLPLGRSDVFATRGHADEGDAAPPVPLPRKKPRKIAHPQNAFRYETLHDQRPEDAGAIVGRHDASRTANTRASARDRSATPTGFWAWSR